MKGMYQGKNGDLSGSKTAFMASLAVCLIKILIGGVEYAGFVSSPPDYAGMGVFIGAVGAVYAARNHNVQNKDK
jgi:hypothetical protein